MLEDVNKAIEKEDLNLALLRAAFKGNTDCVSLLLDHGADINAVDGNSDSALMLAVSNGHIEVMKELLRRGCHSNETNRFHCTPLLKACVCERSDIVQLLLKYISSDSQSNSDILKCPLDDESDAKKTNVKLSNLGQHQIAYLTYDGTSSVSTPLIEAARTNNTEIVKLLLEANVSVDETNSDKATALHIAAVAAGKSHEIIKLLLEVNADIDACREGHITPLMYAVMQKCESNILTLLKHGADATINHYWCGFHKCILYEATLSGASIEVIQALCEAGADIDYKDVFDRTPLYAALITNNVDVIKCLIKYGCCIDTPEKFTNVITSGRRRRTLFYLAVSKKNVDMIRLLFTAGAYTNKILHDCYYDVKLRAKCSGVPHLLEILDNIVSVPQTLMRICRKIVNCTIQKPLPKTIPKLHMPTSIKEFLLYSDI